MALEHSYRLLGASGRPAGMKHRPRELPQVECTMTHPFQMEADALGGTAAC